ncbi:photosystem II cytochrome PsbV2 [Oculatella sp. LEGE 06141]|uniref:photosystem II cytochrome PsbV2 n=1 Tax=Oculatella sp. LEGE 06141 TaxID=1828648 RepID=UPI00188297B4|nr:photosystem II cytochrome PsbV2 [Oculatella sp. LEGE 06141]MBE9178112.1 photosystem II cytochrome PsbV2 [Oculatella sp. LEGE 06141]
MLRQLLSFVLWIAIVGACFVGLRPVAPVSAATLDSYVTKYLDVREPVPMPLNAQGDTRLFSVDEISEGKMLFEENCKNCHVGGATLPDPTVSLSLEALRGATPPRDTIESLVTFLRKPMLYDGSEETFFCREVPESWMSQPEAEKLSAFVLRAAQKAPGWGTNTF